MQVTNTSSQLLSQLSTSIRYKSFLHAQKIIKNKKLG